MLCWRVKERDGRIPGYVQQVKWDNLRRCERNMSVSSLWSLVVTGPRKIGILFEIVAY